jgi:HemY protein
MRAVLSVIVIAALAVGGAWWIEHLVGAVSLQVGTLAIQAPLSVAVLVLLVFAAVLYGLFRIVSALFGLRHVVQRSGERGARKRGDQAVTNVLVALAAREGADAKREAAKARRLLGDTPQTLLLAAYAGSVAGDTESSTEAFEKLAGRKDSAFLGLRGLLADAVAREDWARANDLAKQAEHAHPGTAWLREERTHLAVRTGDWQEALLLSRDNAPHAALAAAAADAETDPNKALKLAKDAFKRDPNLTAAATAYARRLREGGREKQAQDVLRQAWARAPNPDIAALALAPSPDRMARLKAGQALVRDAAESGESHLLLGRLFLEAGLTGEALHHAEVAERGGLHQRRVYVLLADIAEASGTDESHKDAYREALRRASTADPDPAWVCEACGVTHATWQPACPNCHTAGRVRWGAPPRGVTALLPG